MKLHELPPDVIIVHHSNWPYPATRGEHGLIEMTKETLDRIHLYARSTPTAPSAGFIWRMGHLPGL